MRRFKLPIIVTLILTLGLTGCSKDKENQDTQKENELQVTVTPTEEVQTPTEVPSTDDTKQIGFNADELKVLSEELSTQVIDGDCSRVNSYFEESIKKTYTAQVLQDAMKEAVAPLGNFVSIVGTEAKEEDDTIYVVVTMKYENNGLQLVYGYNKDIQLTTFRYQYVSLDQENSKTESELYKEEEIKVGSGEYLLDGIMTIPKNVEKPPVVILIQGSGPSDMDETIGANNNKPFRDIAQGLAEKGIATIRYNKRFQQYGDSVTERVTIADEVLDDVSSAIELAMKSDVLDTSRIFVLGHSLGGMLSPKIATDHPEVAGIIALAGSPRHLEDIIYDQNKYFLDLDETISQEDKESMLETVQTYVDQVKNLSEEDLATPILDVTGYYWKSLNEIDTPTLVKNLKIPMLFLQGSADFQVFADKDFVEWQNILEGHENAQFIQYEGLNHLFMQTTGEKDPSDYDYKNNVDHKVIDDIANWILE